MGTPVDQEELFRRYRRNLPHWRAAGYPYFVTWRLHSLQAPLSPEERTVIAEALRFFDGQRYDLHGFVVMDDHVHVIVLPGMDWKLERLTHSWKSYTAHRLVEDFGRVAPVWQDEAFDRVLRSEKEYYEKAVYLLNNPAKRWADLPEYQWVWVKGMS